MVIIAHVRTVPHVTSRQAAVVARLGRAMGCAGRLARHEERPPHLVDRVYGLVLAQRSGILFPILVYFKYSLKLMQNSKFPIKSYKHQNIAKSILLESL
jgi:hypothetical protein